jgi:hypothetical protein
MARRLQFSGRRGPHELPPVEDFAVVPDRSSLTLAVTTRDAENESAVVFVRIPKDLALDLCTELMQHIGSMAPERPS